MNIKDLDMVLALSNNIKAVSQLTVAETLHITGDKVKGVIWLDGVAQGAVRRALS